MPTLNVDKLAPVVEDMRSVLRRALLATDIWESDRGVSLAAYNGQPEAVAVLTRAMGDLSRRVIAGGLPDIRYALMHVGEYLVITIRHSAGVLQGIILDARQVNLGTLFSIVMPRVIDGVDQARAAA